MGGGVTIRLMGWGKGKRRRGGSEGKIVGFAPKEERGNKEEEEEEECF